MLEIAAKMSIIEGGEKHLPHASVKRQQCVHVWVGERGGDHRRETGALYEKQYRLLCHRLKPHPNGFNLND